MPASTPFNLVTTRNTTTDAGKLYKNDEGSSTMVELTIPSEAVGMRRRPTLVEHRQTRVMAGKFSKTLAITPAGVVVVAGIDAPPAPTVTPVAGGSIPTSNEIAYISFSHYEDTEELHQGNLSDGSTTFSMDGTKQRQWALPGSAQDSRVTHVNLWISSNGGIPRLVAVVPIGTTSFTENTTISTQDTPPVDADGNVKNARGKPPYAQRVIRYHRRAWFSGIDGLPYRWYYSELDEYESVGDQNYIDHLDGETVVAGVEAGDQLLTLGTEVAYVIQGWDEADFRIHKLDGGEGTFNHFSIALVHGYPVIPNRSGVHLYVPGAGFRPLLADTLRTEWEDAYKANPTGFEEACAVNDRVESVYILSIAYAVAPLTRRWVMDYRDLDLAGGSQPRWGFDRRNREDSAIGMLRQSGSKFTELYVGSVDGHIRKENVYTDDDDDNDTYGKPLAFEPPHFQPAGQAGDDSDGFTYGPLDLYLKSETKDWTWEARAGDDSAYLATTPADNGTVEASQLVNGDMTAVPRTAHHITLNGVSGKGLSLRVNIPNAIGAEYRGFGVHWIPGHQTRGFIG